MKYRVKKNNKRKAERERQLKLKESTNSYEVIKDKEFHVIWKKGDKWRKVEKFRLRNEIRKHWENIEKKRIQNKKEVKEIMGTRRKAAEHKRTKK